MCAILGFQAPDNLHSRSLLASLLRESSYRGLHSMSVCWKGGLGVEVEPEFKPHLRDVGQLAHNGAFNVLAHCRYSTSSLNAPGVIQTPEGVTMMNGVICQDLPGNWPMSELEPYATGNDTEIAHRYATLGMWGEHGGAFAVANMSGAGVATFWRNGARPLWSLEGLRDGVCVVSSTRDIMRRAALGDLVSQAILLKPGVVFVRGSQGLKATHYTFDPGPELQPKTPNPTINSCKP